MPAPERLAKALSMKWLVIIGVFFLACGGFAWWFFSQPGPKQLDMLNNVTPGDSDARLLVQDQLYDETLGLGLNIWTPKTAASEPLPVIVFIYGGGWRDGAKDHYAFTGRALANRGYMVVVPDYRLFPKTRFPGFLEDSAKALAWVHDHIGEHGGDAGRIFLSGQSAGAYNAMMLALDRQWLGREGKSPDLIRGVAALAGPYDFYPFDSETTKQSFGDYHTPEMTQPVNFVRSDAPPLWLSSGDNDTQVRPRNSKILRDKILEAGGDAEYVEYPDVDHLEIIMALAKPFRHKAPVLDDMVAFFERHR